MFIFIPIIFVIAGVALVFGHRRFKARKGRETSKVIVSGDTFSECIEQKHSGENGTGTGIETGIVETRFDAVRRCCIVGAGRVGSITGITLASQNQDIQFIIVDSNATAIQAWNSDDLPIREPGLDELFFDDRCLDFLDFDYSNDLGPGIQSKKALEEAGEESRLDERSVLLPVPVPVSGHVRRRRKLSNLTFSTDIAAGVAEAEIIFLCLEMDKETEKGPLDHSYLDSTLDIIAHASSSISTSTSTSTSTGHKIIVQRTTAPYGVTQYVRTKLKPATPSLSKPSFTILTNPDFTLPGSAIPSSLHPQRVIIGHIYTAQTSSSAIAAVKRLYSFVDDSRIVTMDAWSAELGRMSSKAVIAQQVASLGAVRMLCQGCEASGGNVGWMLGCSDLCDGDRVKDGMLDAGLRREVRCLIDFARGREGMEHVVGYWEGVLRVGEVQYRRGIERLLGAIREDVKGREVVVVGGMEEQEEMEVLVEVLREIGAEVEVWDGVSPSGNVKSTVQELEDDKVVTIGRSLEMACSGCCAVITHGRCQVDDTVWQRIVAQMEEPKALVCLEDGVDKVKMGQLGFRVV